MMKADQKLRIGFIPLVDAASLFVAVDKGFAKAEGLEIELVREVSWANIRDRLSIGQYDAAHLLAPITIAGTLGLSHVETPFVASLNLAMNGNAITVEPDLHAALLAMADGPLSDPLVSARALKSVIAAREKRSAEPLTFGVTFPFSTHNYQLRYWMAEGGIEPDRDVRLVVVPPPYMVEKLANREVDGFCVGAPWNAVAAEAGVGVVLHPGCAIFDPAPEKTLAIRQQFATVCPEMVTALIRACLRATEFLRAPDNLEELVSLLAKPNRVGVDKETLRHTLMGRLNDYGVVPDYLIFGDATSGRPDPYQASWLYAQMARWGQARFSPESLHAAQAVYDASYFDAATGVCAKASSAPIKAFSGAQFDGSGIEGYLRSFR